MKHLQALVVIFMSAVLASNSAAASTIKLAAAAHGTTQRIDGNLDSWMALLIVVASFVTAWTLNYQAPRVRAFGTALAATGCLALAGWFFLFVLNTGFLEDPKPNQTPMDSAKPMLLWAQALMSLLSGILLAVVSFKQRHDSNTLDVSYKNEAHRYGRVSRILHWSTALLFLALIPMGIFASIIPEGTPYRNAYYVVHKTIGVIALLLVVIRLVWNYVSRRPHLDESLTSFERKAARGAHVLLYIMMIALPVTGFVMTSYHGYPTYFFAWEVAPLWEPSNTATIIWGSMHKYLLPYVLYIVLGAHILGALKHKFIDKHAQSLKRMIF